ncbi:hypothetical protein ABFS82_11G016600 [Erythranthe guttata]
MNVNDDSEKHKPKSMANLYPVLIALSFSCFLIKSAAVRSNATRGISVNCGSTGTSAARSGRVWIGDVWPEYPYLLQVKGASTISAVVGNSISADPIPYKRARISRSQFVYAFLVMPGQNIIRLHFNPSKYRGFQGLKDLFTVEAGPFTLLSNFSPSLTADALGVGFFAKEFLLNIPEYERLNIIFSPGISESLDTYAFVNGIEIFSVPPPSSVSYFQDGDYSTALEILEVEQISVPYAGDSGYAHPFPFSISQNAKYNTWKIPVDVGFKYLVRVHFLEKGLKFALAGVGNGIPPYRDYTVVVRGNTDKGKRDILIPLQSYDELIDVMFKDIANEIVADFNVQLVRGSDGNNIPSYSDSMVMMKEKGEHIFIRLQSYDSLIDAPALVSGVEIFKAINSYNSAWSPSGESFFLASIRTTSTIFILVFTIYFLRVIFVLKSWKTWKAIITEKKINFFEKMKRWKSSSRIGRLQETSETDSSEEINDSEASSNFQQQLQETWEAIISYKEKKPKSSSGAERLCRRFSLDEIRLATNNFSDALLIGRGGYGNVYKGHIDEEQCTVAVKRLKKSSSKQGESEFWTEIETLFELRHVNIVSLIGYCNEHGERILVYEYIPCGTLADHLYRLARKSNSCSTLTWKQRLDICIGAGRGLDYLHMGCGVIHRDVKASNILLDENFVAKVSDFGLSRLENRSKSQSYVSTLVKGTVGYFDPSYFLTGQLTRKSDTYGFGVVLLEVLCGRPAIDTMAAEDEKILSRWAQDKINKGEVEEIISESLREEISPNSLKTFLKVVERCLHDEPKKRPTMSEVVSQLELAVEQQEAKQVSALNQIARVSNDNHHPDEYVVDPDEYVVDDPLFIRTKEDEEQNKIYSHEGNLKECVLFCSVFPSGYEFTKDMLVWQWVAKSLINLSEDEIEEVYIQCFDKLLNLDFIVPSGYCHFADEVKYKVGHNMTMFLQNQLLEPKFQNNLEGKQRRMVKVENLSLAFKEIDHINFRILKQCTRLQTLIIHRCYGSKVNYLPPDLFLELKALKILNLSHTNIKELPSSVENLEEVRYLDMSETPIKWLPESILCLGHLQTLKLDGCLSLVGLPKCTSNLINLRHLVLDIVRQLQSMPTGIGKLSKLRTLGAFLVGEEDGTRIGELKNMNSLRGSLRLLNLENVPTKEEAAEAYLCKKHGLKKIELQWSDLQDEKNPNEEEILNSIQPPFSIQELKILFYSGGVFPSWISNPSFSELVNITLYRCRYCDTLPSIGELPSLKLLNIIENNEVKEINSFFCRKESNEHHVAFPKLEKLSFDSMSELEQWTGLKEGDFPCLSYLIIQYCPELIGISFLSHLSSLSHLEISYCPKITCLPEGGLPLTLESLMIKDCPELKERCCNKQCEDWSKVARVPAFYIDNEKVSV